jgi:hypothetical protein
MNTITTQTPQFTRKDYLSGQCTHEQYYAQFINDAGIALVQRSEAFKKLQKSKSTDLSSVELAVWDRIGTAGESVNLMKSLGDIWSAAGAVCINKAIARQLLGIV